MSDGIEVLAKRLRALQEEWGDDMARSAFARQIAALSPEERERLTILVFGENNQVGTVSIGDVSVGDIAGGDIRISADARISGVAVGVNLGRIVYGQYPEEGQRHRLVQYLSRLASRLQSLPLRGLETTLDEGEAIRLSKVYTSIATTSRRLFTQGTIDEVGRYFDDDKLDRNPRQEFSPDWALPNEAIVDTSTASSNEEGTES